jgi:RNA polymerase sigma-70 factor (ECF subfamily)
MSESDGPLLERAIEGDAEALRELLERFGGQVHAQIRRQVPQRWRTVLDEDDVMQVAYLEAFLNISHLNARDPPAFVAWLGSIARNSLHDALRVLRRRKRPDPARRVHAGGTDSSAMLLEMLTGSGTTPSRHAARNEAGRTIDAVLAQLPPDYGAVVRMYDLEGRSAADVAAAMGRSQGAVYMLRARAHEHMRVRLGSASRFLSDGM